MKRLFDILFSWFVLSVFLPFGIIIALLIVIGSRGGAFYFQTRVGKDGRIFRLMKFRTMRKNADKTGKLTVGMDDPRITKMGAFLRKTKLDEFPQFINVLKGDMSVVGPRPEVEEYVKLYNDDQREVLSIRPGITDYASLKYYRENEILGKSDNPQKTYIEEIMPAKLALNKEYMKNRGFATDFGIIWKTFTKMFR